MASVATPTEVSIRPFRVDIPDEALAELRRRIEANRWPPKELVPDASQGVQAPRSWVEKVYPNLIYFHEVDKGGHFAAWEEPEEFSQEMRAAFRSLR